jgi:hypothetical protein
VIESLRGRPASERLPLGTLLRKSNFRADHNSQEIAKRTLLVRQRGWLFSNGDGAPVFAAATVASPLSTITP